MNFDCWDVDGNQINHDQLLKACDFDHIQENFDYTMMCFRESLRIEPPVAYSTSHTVTRDIVLAKGTPKELKIDAGAMIHISFDALHHDPKNWGNNHNEYIPERFDSQSEHFNAPDGHHRNPFAFGPFLGGHRICLGKTFAETVAKKLIAMIMKFYTLEHADPAMKLETFEYSILQLAPAKIHFTFKRRAV